MEMSKEQYKIKVYIVLFLTSSNAWVYVIYFQ